jgi:hypothetical protein
VLPHLRLDAERRQTGLGIAAVPLDMHLEGHLQRLSLVLTQEAAPAQDFSKRRLLLEQPGVHSLKQLLARHKIHLQGEQPEDQVAVG